MEGRVTIVRTECLVLVNLGDLGFSSSSSYFTKPSIRKRKNRSTEKHPDIVRTVGFIYPSEKKKFFGNELQYKLQ